MELEINEILDGIVSNICDSQLLHGSESTPRPFLRCVEMGSSATSPNISPNISPSRLSSPNKTPDICHNYCDLSFTVSQRAILESTMNSNKIKKDSKVSTIPALESFTPTHTFPLVIDRKLSCSNNNQSATVTSDSSSNANSKFESSSTSSALRACTNFKNNRIDSIQNKSKDEDKYPCLRRALSCNETPILPLGTYALEFGFDVCSLPFKPYNNSVPKITTCVNECPSPSVNPSKDHTCCNATDPSPKKLSSYQSETTKSISDIDTAISNITYPISQNDCASALNRSIDTAPCEQSLPKRLKRDSGSEATNDQNKNKFKPQIQEKINEIRSENKQTYEKHSLLHKLQISSINMDDVELDPKTNSVFEESYWYATKWKKDNRKWLWKCSQRTKPEIIACNAMSRQQKKDDSIWSMKPSIKKI